jgi:hypothetical protein
MNAMDTEERLMVGLLQLALLTLLGVAMYKQTGMLWQLLSGPLP